MILISRNHSLFPPCQHRCVQHTTHFSISLIRLDGQASVKRRTPPSRKVFTTLLHPVTDADRSSFKFPFQLWRHIIRPQLNGSVLFFSGTALAQEKTGDFRRDTYHTCTDPGKTKSPPKVLAFFLLAANQALQSRSMTTSVLAAFLSVFLLTCAF